MIRSCSFIAVLMEQANGTTIRETAAQRRRFPFQTSLNNSLPNELRLLCHNWVWRRHRERSEFYDSYVCLPRSSVGTEDPRFG